MTDALYIYIKGSGQFTETTLTGLPPHLADRAKRQWERLSGQTALMEKELEFCRKHNIQVLCYTDADYPERLKICEDAPLVLFYLGNAPLNSRPVISIVGTRHITPYGKELCAKITDEIAKHVPSALIVSGLAYGADIHAHRGSLTAGLSTVGVLAHGLDRIYPYLHKETAAQMTRQGGLLTEYPTCTEPERHNFVHRNRIVAAIADCTIVIESAARGGSMITLNRATEFGKKVWACPGRLTDIYSEGCNRAIAEGKALPFISVQDLIQKMGWSHSGAEEAHQQSLFNATVAEFKTASLSDESQQIIDLLRQGDGLTADTLSTQTGLPAHIVAAELMEMEMQGLITMDNGTTARLSHL